MSVMSSMNAIGRSTVSGSPSSRMCASTSSLESHEPTPVPESPGARRSVDDVPHVRRAAPRRRRSCPGAPRRRGRERTGSGRCRRRPRPRRRRRARRGRPCRPATTSAPAAASARAAGESGERVSARTRHPSASSRRATAPPWRPVAPRTAIVARWTGDVRSGRPLRVPPNSLALPSVVVAGSYPARACERAGRRYAQPDDARCRLTHES